MNYELYKWNRTITQIIYSSYFHNCSKDPFRLLIRCLFCFHVANIEVSTKLRQKNTTSVKDIKGDIMFATSGLIKIRNPVFYKRYTRNYSFNFYELAHPP